MSALPAEFDQWSRPFGVLRVSLTARCNLACPYCCPDQKDPPGLLNLDQHLRLIRVASGLGIHPLLILLGNGFPFEALSKKLMTRVTRQ